MKFLIHEIGAYPGIINIKIGDSRLSWDFPLGSSYDLCAVFDRRKGRNLQEFQIARVRPMLFHKDLKTACRFSEDLYTDGFLLYPAKLVEGRLDIGNQLRGQDARLPIYDRSITVRQVRMIEGLFKSELKFVKNYTVREDSVTETTNDGFPVIYYRITEDENQTTYSLPIVSEDVSVVTGFNETISFFSDRACRNRLL